MSSVPKSQSWSNVDVPNLLSRAASVLASEMSRAPGVASTPLYPQTPVGNALPNVEGSLPNLQGKACPVSGAHVPIPGTGKPDARKQAHELLGTLFAAFGPSGYSLAGGGHPSPLQSPAYSGKNPESPAGAACPITHAQLPVGGFDKDQLRRRAHEFIDTLLVTFRDATDEDGVVAENKVPLLQCASPVQAGAAARVTLTVANEEPTPSEVSLYCTNFVTDSGNEIPSLRVSSSPRLATIPAHGRAEFEIRIAVPQQTPTGTYSGLIQAMGSKYVKAVLSVQVL
jgi:hypothetical protein